MITLTLTDALRDAAKRCVWFETPDRAVGHPACLAAYILTYGAYEDTETLRDQVSDDQLRELLDATPPGIFDGRSWAYWNLMVGRPKAPPMPTRSFV